jgi:hypothetical protein
MIAMIASRLVTVKEFFSGAARGARRIRERARKMIREN